MTKIRLDPRSKPGDVVSKNSIAGIDLPLAYKALISAYVRIQSESGGAEDKSVDLNACEGIVQHEEGTLQGRRTSRV